MTYVVTGGHPETLKSGRSVAPRDEISNSEARQNPRLIERGVLTERVEAKKPASKSPAKPDPKPQAQSAPEKEENQ
jgi:hypothetical protein